MEYDYRDLAIPLPEDITKLKWGGDFKTALEVIEARVNDARTPETLKRRLLLERELLPRIPGQYPYDWEAALSLLRAKIRGFKDEELRTLFLENTCEWIYIGGKVHFHEMFLDNLLKTRADYQAREIPDTACERNRETEEAAGAADGPESSETAGKPAPAERKSTAASAETGSPESETDKNRELLCENVIRTKDDRMRRVHIHLKATIRLTEAGREKCLGKQIRVYLPLPVEYEQVHNYRLCAIEPLPETVAGPQYPQRTAVFETEYTGAETFSAEFEFDNVIEYHDPDPEKVLSAQPSFYTEEQLPHIRFTPYIRALCAEIVGAEANPLLKARKIYDYVTTHVKYSYVRAYSTVYDIPEYAGVNLKGDCGFQALLFITLCRCAGVPARWQSGLYATPYYVGSHDWAQYYVAPYGWLFADCSFGGSAYRQGDEERRVFYGANLDPYRVPQASEFQHEFIVPAGAVRFDPYDNQVGEIICEGRALSGYGADFETVYDLIELRETY